MLEPSQTTMLDMIRQQPPLYDDLPRLEKRAVELLQENEPPGGYELAFSGGKDSIVIYHLAERAGIQFAARYNFVPLDPPELRQFIRSEYPDIVVARQKMSFPSLCEKKKMLPTRKVRWCCEYYKHGPINERRVILGIRAEESPRRAKKWGETENEYGDDAILPIFWWPTEDIWRYIDKYDVKYCSLYDEGFKRLGCILCPQVLPAKKRRDIEMARWPGIVKLWRKGAERAFQVRGDSVKFKFATADEYFDWWLSGVSVEKWEKGKLMRF